MLPPNSYEKVADLFLGPKLPYCDDEREASLRNWVTCDDGCCSSVNQKQEEEGKLF